tara:strand:+ start:1084 stop:1647 length:564 start_codon:yes stop_codon:yes gene_type:complete
MEVINDVNELLTTKLCSPVIVLGVTVVVSLVSIYLNHRSLSRYNTLKMENLKNITTIQEIKYLILLGVIMFGLCQYNKTELAWIFLIFPIIYVIIQNILLYVHLSSALQNAPQDQIIQGGNYGLGMNAPLLDSQGPSKPVITKPEQTVPVVNNGGFEFSKPSNNTGSLMTGSNTFSSGSGGGWDSAF